MQRAGDVKLLQRAGLGEPPAASTRMALAGTLKATGTPLRAPFPTECLAYSYEILPLSLKHGSIRQSISLGGALKPLRNEGVVILASGLSWHNLRHRARGEGVVSRV